MTAILGTFVKIGTLADGTPRLVLDLQCSLSEVAAMGLSPGVAFGIARITGEASMPKEEKTKPGELCIMACNFCDDPAFWKWANVFHASNAKDFICNRCEISSRRELDTNSEAAHLFHTRIRKPFLAWKEKQ